MIAHVQIRATHGDLLDDERLNKLRELCEELALFNETTIDGWTIEVVEAREAECSYTRDVSLLTRDGLAPAPHRCDQAATVVVGGSEWCDWHAVGARRLMGALGRPA